MNTLETQIQTADSFKSFNEQCASFYVGDVVPVTTTGTYGNASNTVYWNTYPYYNKTEKAFSVIRALMKAKIVKVTSLDKFFTLMDEVIKVL